MVRRSHVPGRLVTTEGDRKLRLRIRDDLAAIAFKGLWQGITRGAFAYPIPLAEALHKIDRQWGADPVQDAA